MFLCNYNYFQPTLVVAAPSLQFLRRLACLLPGRLNHLGGAVYDVFIPCFGLQLRAKDGSPGKLHGHQEGQEILGDR